MEKDKISDEEFERIKSHLDKYSYVDLVIWRNDMINGCNVNNRLFNLINNELMRRSAERYNLKHEGKSK